MDVSPNGELSVDDAVNQLAAAELSADEGIEDTVETEADDDAAPTVEADAEENSDAEDETDEDFADDEDFEAEDAPVADVYEVNINGETREVSLEDLKKNYQLGENFKRKSDGLSMEREAAQRERQAIASERQQYAQALETVSQILQAQNREPDWARLKEEDPIGYLEQRDAWRENRERIASIEQERARVAQHQEAERQAELDRLLATQRGDLVERIPQWKDKDVATREKAAISEYALSQGFTQDEVDTVVDARAVQLLHKAWKYDQMISKGQERKRTQPTVKPAKGGTPTNPKARASRRKQGAFDRLSKSGSVEDAVKYLLS